MLRSLVGTTWLASSMIRRTFAVSTICGCNKKSMIGVIGAGSIGRAVSKGLLTSGHVVMVTDPDTTNSAELVEDGAQWVTESNEIKRMIKKVDVLITCLPAPVNVRQVMEKEGALENLRPGSCWIDHTTTDKDETKRLAAIAERRGIDMLEAPLTGGLSLLKIGQMTTMVGGKKELLERHEPLLRSYTKTILHVGPIGSASVIKVISNLLAGAHLVLAGEALLLAKRQEIDLKGFFDGIRASAGNSYVFETEVPLMFNGTYEPGFAIGLHLKDFRLGRTLAEESKTPTQAFSLVEEIYKKAMYKYGEEAGSSIPAKLIEDEMGETLQLDGFNDWTYEIAKVQGGGIAVVHKNIH